MWFGQIVTVPNCFLFIFPALKPDEINEKLVQLWSKFPEEEKFVYSKVAKNEILLMQGKDIQHVKKEESNLCSPSLFRHPMFPSK